MSTTERVVWGTHPAPRRHLRRALVGFATLVLASYALVALLTRPPLAVLGPRVAEALFGLVTFYGPVLAAVLGTLRGGGLLAAVAVGIVPAVAFLAVATALSLLVGPTGDAPAWALALVFAGTGGLGGIAGYLVVVGGRLALRRYRAG